MPRFQVGASALASMCRNNINLTNFAPRIQDLAKQIESARQQGEQIPASTQWRTEGLGED